MNTFLILIFLPSCLSIDINLVGNLTQHNGLAADSVNSIANLTISRWSVGNAIVTSQQIVNKVSTEIDILTEEMLRITNTIINIGGDDLSLDCLNGHRSEQYYHLISSLMRDPLPGAAGSPDECFNLATSQNPEDIIIMWISHGYCRAFDMNGFDNSDSIEWDQSYFTHYTEFDNYGNWYRTCRLSVANQPNSNQAISEYINSIQVISDLTISRWKLSNAIVSSQQVRNKATNEINALTEEMLRINNVIMDEGGESLTLNCLNGQYADEYYHLISSLWYAPSLATAGSPEECFSWLTSQIADDIIFLWISGSQNGRAYCRAMDMNRYDNSDEIGWDQSYYTRFTGIEQYGQWYRTCRLSSSVN